MQLDVCIIGAQKCATSTLAKQMSHHPDIRFCLRKEPHFFSQSPDPERELDYYFAQFPQGDGLTAEASTSYSFVRENPEAIPRLARHNPAMKLIYLVRDPMDRIVSNYQHRKLTGEARGSLQDEVLSKPYYVDRCRYGEVIQKCLEHFPQQQLRVICFDEFTNDSASTWRQLSSWLGICEPGPEVLAVTPQNVSKVRAQQRLPFTKRALAAIGLWKDDRPEVTEQLRSTVLQTLHNDIAWLAQYTGRNLAKWGER